MFKIYQLIVPYKLRNWFWKFRHSKEMNERLKDPNYAYLHYKLLFIHIPKSAGISIHSSIYNIESPGHLKNGTEYKTRYSQVQWLEMYKFTFVRNPYTRLYSAYNYLASGGRQVPLDKAYQKKLMPYINFEDFVLNGLKKLVDEEILHFIPQMTFITDDKGKVIVDFIGKFENLEDDIKKLSKKTPTKIPLKIDFYNKGKKQITNYNLVYTKEMRKIIEEIYNDDLRQLNYQFPSN